MNTVLFPTDFSKNAQHAFRYAKAMAKGKRAKLILLYAYDLPLIAPTSAFTTRGQALHLIDQNLRDAALQQMEQYTNELDLLGENYAVLIKEGNAANVIAEFCLNEVIDLIVMGTKGKSDDREFLMGSVTARLVGKVKIPVLSIPESAAIRPLKQVVFATNLIYNSEDEIQKAINFAMVNSSSLTFLHIQTDIEKNNSKLNELSKILEFNKNENVTLTVIQDNDVVHGIGHYLKDNDPDLLVLSTHTKSLYEKLFHKSIRKEMVLNSKVPLLIFSKEIHPIVFF
jgi:nucleotide-binding universal stress UspA family protein